MIVLLVLGLVYDGCRLIIDGHDQIAQSVQVPDLVLAPAVAAIIDEVVDGAEYPTFEQAYWQIKPSHKHLDITSDQTGTRVHKCNNDCCTVKLSESLLTRVINANMIVTQ